MKVVTIQDRANEAREKFLRVASKYPPEHLSRTKEGNIPLKEVIKRVKELGDTPDPERLGDLIKGGMARSSSPFLACGSCEKEVQKAINFNDGDWEGPTVVCKECLQLAVLVLDGKASEPVEKDIWSR